MSDQDEPFLAEDEQKQLALKIMLEAWEDALSQGVRLKWLPPPQYSQPLQT